MSHRMISLVCKFGSILSNLINEEKCSLEFLKKKGEKIEIMNLFWGT